MGHPPPPWGRLCRGWARWGGHVRWEGTGGGGSLRGGDRAKGKGAGPGAFRVSEGESDGTVK